MKILGIIASVVLLMVSYSCSEGNDREPIRSDGSMDAAAPETGSHLDASPFSDSGNSSPDPDSGDNGNGDDGGKDDAIIAEPWCDNYSDESCWCYSDERLADSLHRLCYKDTRPCDGYQVRTRMILATGNSPFDVRPDGTPVHEPRGFVLIGQCVESEEHLDFAFGADETIDPAIISGLKNQPYWKVEIANSVIRYCESCYTQQGLIPLFGLNGSLADVRFFQDLEDEYPLFIEVRDAEGNLVADFR